MKVKEFKANELETGNVYLLHDGRLMLYLGKGSDEKLNFYRITSIDIDISYDNNIEIINKNIVLPHIQSICESVANSELDGKCLLKYTNIPRIIAYIYRIKYIGSADQNNSVLGLLKRIEAVNKHNNLSDNTDKNNYKPVGVRDLEPGRVYLCGASQLGKQYEGWRATYIFLGRTLTKKFVWVFVGSPEIVKSNEYLQYLTSRNVDVTMSNKKCYKPIYYKELNKFKLNERDTKRLLEYVINT
ncbi:MAG: hypothetical protein IJ593_04340 [Lachnospiraceae bacterium]|nr:hypothetical protein [Lachnospiraceae bacterium]